jgi:hypothetical protein
VPSIRIIERNGGLLSGETISQRSGKPIRQYWLDTLPSPDQAGSADKSAAIQGAAQQDVADPAAGTP